MIKANPLHLLLFWALFVANTDLQNTCNPSVSQCITCSSQVVCTSSIPLYKINDVHECVPDCILIDHNYRNSAPPLSNCPQSVSERCSAGRRWICACANGQANINQFCDDGSNNYGDCCSLSCIIQQIDSCQQGAGADSTCILKDVSMTFSYALKDANANEFTAYYDIRPNLPLLRVLNWTKALKFASDDITIMEAEFYPTKGTLKIECAYAADLIGKKVVLIFAIPPQNIPHEIISQNNLALIYYNPSTYTLASIVDYICLCLSAASLLLFLLGFITGKLIALENLAAFQLTYLCTVTIHNASPTSAALRSLSLSAGIIQLGNYNYSSSIDRQFKGVSFGADLLSSCSFGYAIIILFVLIASLLKVLSVTCCKHNKIIKGIWPSLLGQTVFYSVVFSSYDIFSQLFFGLTEILSGMNQLLTVVGVSFLFSLLISVYSYFLYKKPEYFGVFKRKFQKFNICEHFYIFIIIQRFLSALIIITLRNLSLGLLVELLPIGALIAFVAIRTPYVESDSRRALINYAITAANVSFVLIDNILGKASPIYLPMIVLLLLASVLFYNSFRLVKELKEIYYTAAQSKQGSILRLLIENMLNQKIFENIEQKNQFQLREFKFKITNEAPSLNPILSSKNEGLYAPFDRQRIVKEQWEFYATLSRSKILNRFKDGQAIDTK